MPLYSTLERIVEKLSLLYTTKILISHYLYYYQHLIFFRFQNFGRCSENSAKKGSFYTPPTETSCDWVAPIPSANIHIFAEIAKSAISTTRSR